MANADFAEPEVKKPLKEVTVIQDQGLFRHTTGDTYDGFFEIKKNNRTVYMNGPGVYRTAEGDIYTGTWENDRLNADVTVQFADTSFYEGGFKDWCYSGKGKYLYPDGSLLICDFIENMPVGDLKLEDPNMHTWLGRAEQGFGWFEPINHYYAMLETTRDLTRVKRREKKQTQELSAANLPANKIVRPTSARDIK